MRIAVDGPSGSGKSTISKALAKEFKLNYLDTGAMYRAVTAWLLKGKDRLSEGWLINFTKTKLRIETDPENFRIWIDENDVTEEIRTQRITDWVSQVSAEPLIREWMVDLQRTIMNQSSGIVMEGRDIGTVVMPDADIKIFIEADIEKRTSRRALELSQNSHKTKESLKSRDKMDSTRKVSPLIKAKDAVLIDTSELSISESIAKAREIVNRIVKND